jgi:hypothetical protein
LGGSRDGQRQHCGADQSEEESCHSLEPRFVETLHWVFVARGIGFRRRVPFRQ